MIYTPTPGTIAARALEVIEKRLRGKPQGAWLPNLDVAAAIDVKPNSVRPSLDRAIEVGLVERSMASSGYLQWRMAQPKPPRRSKKSGAPSTRFHTDWPPGFVSQFDSVAVPAWDAKGTR